LFDYGFGFNATTVITVVIMLLAILDLFVMYTINYYHFLIDRLGQVVSLLVYQSKLNSSLVFVVHSF
jgi:hypothetical protein